MVCDGGGGDVDVDVEERPGNRQGHRNGAE